MPTLPLRPLTAGDVLDGATTMLRRHARSWLPFAVAGLLATVPPAVPAIHIIVTSGDDPSPAELQLVLGLFLLVAALWSVTRFALSAVVSAVIVDDVLGRSQVPALRRVGAAWVSVGTAAVVGGLATTAGAMVCLVPGTLVGALFSAAPAACVEERRSGWSAVGRATELALSSVRSMWLGTLADLIATVMAVVLWLPFLVAGELIAGRIPYRFEDLARVSALTIGLIVAGGAVAGYRAAVDSLVYLDLRIRREGLDLIHDLGHDHNGGSDGDRAERTVPALAAARTRPLTGRAGG